GVAVDGSGNVVVTGQFFGTVDFGGGVLSGTGGLDIFAAKFSGTDGSHTWSKRFGSTSDDYGQGVAVDSSGKVAVTGFFIGTVDFGGGGLTSAANTDIFVAKYSGTDGSYLWSKRFGSTSDDIGNSVAVDSSGNVVVTGFFNGTVDFGGGGLTSAESNDIFVAKYSGAEGSHLWSKRFGSTSTDQGLGVAVDSSDNVVVTGLFTGTVNFGGGNLTSAGAEDIFLVKLLR
ncbi:MAG: SBBP repeat-containing protein, partial [Acidobacteria bacterium]|nr:SBBP repeat-containing protein [Acidobacteriota bacterium]